MEQPKKSRDRVVAGMVFRQVLLSLADNFSTPYIGYYLASLTSSGTLQGLLQFSTNSLPTVVQVLVGPLIDWWRKYVAVLLVTSTASSLLWIAVYLTTIPELFVSLVALRAVATGLSGLAFTALLGVLFPAPKRGRVLSLVNIASQFSALAVLALTAFVLVPDIGLLRYLFLLSGFIGLAASSIWVKLLYLDRAAVSESPPGERGLSPFRGVVEAASDRSFMKFNLAYSGYVAVMSVAWPWFPVAQKYVFRMSVADLAVMNIFSTISTTVSQYFLMKYLHRLSMKWLMVVSRAGFVIPPLFYSIAPGPELVYLSSALAGPFAAIGNVVVPLYALSRSRGGMYASYLSLLNFSQGIATAIGSAVGGFAMDYLISSAGGDYGALRVGFIGVAALRAAMTVPFLKVDDVKQAP